MTPVGQCWLPGQSPFLCLVRFILQILVDILKICITVYINTTHVFNLSASSELYRQGSPLIIQWSKTVNGFIEATSPDYHKQFAFSQERSIRKNMNNIDNDDASVSNIKKLRRKKRKRKQFKSAEVLSSTDSSDFGDNEST